MEGGYERARGVASRQPRTRSPARSPVGGSDFRRPSRSSSPVPARKPSLEPARRPSRCPGPERPHTTPARLVGPLDVTQVFRRFDINGDGKIDRNELATVLHELDPVLWTNRNATLLLMSLDTNFDGHVDYAEFVAWVSADGVQQTEFRNTTGMPRSRAELAKLEKERKAAAIKGTAAELDQKKAIAAHRQEVFKSATERVKSARERYDVLKVEAEKASQTFMPMYEHFKDASADVAVPARELLEHDMKDACERVEVEDPQTRLVSLVSVPPIGIQLTAQAMCALFKVHPGTRVKSEPDYWGAFLEAVLNPKLLMQMEKFDKETMPNAAALRIKEVCKDERFAPDRVRVDAQKMMRTSNFIVTMCLWVHFLAKYHQAGVKRLWDQVYQAENEVHKEGVIAAGKDDELKEVRREIVRLEAAMSNA